MAFPLGNSPTSLEASHTCDVRLQGNVILEFRPSDAPGHFKKSYGHQKASLPAVWKVTVHLSLNFGSITSFYTSFMTSQEPQGSLG